MLKATFVLFSAALLAIAADTVGAQVKGCAAGTAVQGIDFGSKKLVCVPVGGAGALKVVDARGLDVGMYSGSGTLAREVENEWISLPFSRDGFFAYPSFQVLFETADCTGTSYFNNPGPVIPRTGFTIIQGGYVTVYLPTTSTTTKTIHSYGNWTPAGIVDCTPVRWRGLHRHAYRGTDFSCVYTAVSGSAVS